MKFSVLSRPARFLLTAVVALVVGGLVALGFSAPAFATTPDTVTIKVVNKAGSPLSSVDVYPIQVQDGVVQQPGGADLPAATPVTGKPGYFTAQLYTGDVYTLEIDPTGSAAADGTWQLLGGGEDIDQAQTFSPTGDMFITATFDNEGVITGKVTSPTGAVLKGAEADVYYYDAGQWVLGSYALTGSTGVYSLTNLQPGSYKLKFWSPTGAYPPVYSGGVDSLDAASTVVIAPGKTLTVNAKFVTFTGSISGTALANYQDFGEVIPSFDAVATAYPVLTTEDVWATSIDYGHPVSSGHANSKGAWTISNLKPGKYIVHIEPYYYNEAQMWVGAGNPDQGLEGAEVIEVGSGSKISTGTTTTWGYADDSTGDGVGAGPEFFAYGPGNTPITARITVTNPSDGLEYLSGTSTNGAEAQMYWGDGTAFDPSKDDLQPGMYTITAIDPTGQHEVYQETTYLAAFSSSNNLVLPALTTAPGFSNPGSVTGTDTTVGTQYSVTGATSARSDGTISYQWLRDGQPIYSSVSDSDSATSATYTSTGADFGHHLSVRVTISSFGFNPVTEILDGPAGDETAGAAATNNGDQPSIIVPPAGVYTGTVLQANVGGWSLPGLQFHYIWKAGAGGIGTDSPTLVVPSSAIGESISVIVQATKAGYDDSDLVSSSNSVIPQAHPAPLVTKSPTITKVVSHGTTTYTGSAGTWNTTGLTFSYAWTEGDPETGSPLSSSNKFAAVGTGILSDPVEFTVTAKKDGYLDGTKTVIVNKGSLPLTETTAPVMTDTDAAGNESDGPGQSQVGEHLVVTSHADWIDNAGNGPTSYTYQWYRQKPGTILNPTPGPLIAITGATGSTYIEAAADIGYNVSVRETAVSSSYTSASAFSNSLSATGSVLLLRTNLPVTLHGIAAQGQVLSATLGAWPVSGVTNTYQWRDCPSGSTCDPSDLSSYLFIHGQSKSTLTYLSSYGNVILQIEGNKTGYAAGFGLSAVATSHPATNIVTLSNPSISGLVGGKAQVGVKLTAVSGKYSVAGLTVHYQWVNCPVGSGCDLGVQTLLSTASTYTPTVDAYNGGNYDIMLIETVSRTGYTMEDFSGDDSGQYEILPGTIKVTKAPTVTTGSTQWTVNNGTYSVTGGNSLVLWYVDGQLQNADDSTNQQSLDREFSTQAVWETSTYSAPGYNPVTTQLLVLRGTEMTLPTTESISGAAYGDKLQLAIAAPFTTPYGSIPLTYQWYSNGVAIKGATASSFTPSTAYIGHHIQVKVTGSSQYYGSLSTLTSSSFVLATGSLGSLTLPTVTFTGTLMPGTVMTGNAPTGYVPTGVTIARQWQKSTNGGTTWVSISKATASTYTPAATDVGAEFRVQVTSSKAGYGTQVLWSAGATVQYSPTLATLAPPVVTGNPAVGSVLTANVGTWNTPSLTYTYQWFRDGVLIPGATASTYTPDFTDATDTLSFQVTASRVGWQSVTVDSNDQVIGLGTITATVQPKITVSGSTYTVSTGSWSVDGLVFSYQWQVAGVNATGNGATTDSYTRAPSDSGSLTVNITVSRPGYNDLPLTVTGPNLATLV